MTKTNREPKLKEYYLLLHIDDDAPVRWEWITLQEAENIIKLAKEDKVVRNIKICKLTTDSFIYDPLGNRKKYRSYSITKRYLLEF